MRFGILGSFEVEDDSGEVRTPGASKPRVLLAHLVTNANRVVSVERLIDQVWRRQPPRTARTALHVYVSKLRRLLGGTSTTPDGSMLVTQPPGYLLRLGGASLDSQVFDTLLATARTRADQGRLCEASRLIADALGLWRGPALADVRSAGGHLENEARRLDEARMTAYERRVEIDLQLDRHADLVGDLYAAIADHPMRESLHEYLMVALHRSGRPGEALEVYRAIRRSLQDTLGLEPGPRLQRVQRAVLTRTPEELHHHGGGAGAGRGSGAA
ncbi:AfsR/SARP family transcriptional regulator, partial [Actinoalloteichus spitiensis]|uniref:AfsR/SARP family transcriptional regulator n=1 Tax=Actinoalloteichus spitiensis TaxID=252394 RepID=UPI000382CA98